MNKDLQSTLVLLKPDAVQRGLIGTILAKVERRGLKVVAMKLLQVTPDLAEQHYRIHKTRPFFQGLVAFITSSPIVAIVLQGPAAIDLVRNTIGATDPAQAAPGTIRGDLATDIGRNLIHGSDSMESARAEIRLFFQDDEILDYSRDIDPWIIES